jgi:hypothetical protein
MREGGGRSVCMSEKSQDLRYLVPINDMPTGSLRGGALSSCRRPSFWREEGLRSYDIQTLVLGSGADVEVADLHVGRNCR